MCYPETKMEVRMSKRECPTCGGDVIRHEGCLKCAEPDCIWSKC
jgi:ribosomal protein L32